VLAVEKLEDQYANQMKELKGDLQEKDAVSRTFRAQELRLSKRNKKIEEAKESLELEMARKLDEEPEKIREEILKKNCRGVQALGP
jgi:hypothetical protein